MSMEGVDSKKIMIMTALSILIIFFSFEPNSIEASLLQRGGASLNIAGSFRVVISVTSIIIGLIYIYYSVKIYWATLKINNLKYFSFLFLVGALFVGMVSSLSVAMGLSLIIPGIYALFLAVGALICAIIMMYQPKLAYILTFKVYRLIVFETAGGLPLFIHNWSKIDEKIDSMIFSEMIHAMNKYTEISMQRNIREIHLDKAILIVQRNKEYSVVCVLIASKSSQFLRDSIRSFLRNFIRDFSPYFSDPSNQNNFLPAEKMISKYFPFVSEYD
ncbi:MAG: hypothetical protein ACTSO9_01200 [Candidatus Helarchaeota archaeon]